MIRVVLFTRIKNQEANCGHVAPRQSSQTSWSCSDKQQFRQKKGSRRQQSPFVLGTWSKVTVNPTNPLSPPVRLERANLGSVLNRWPNNSLSGFEEEEEDLWEGCSGGWCWSKKAAIFLAGHDYHTAGDLGHTQKHTQTHPSEASDFLSW